MDKIKEKALQTIRIIQISLIFIVVTLPLLFAVLRAAHVILYVGDRYTNRFETFYSCHDEGIKDKNMSEIVYMKRLSSFSALETHITDYGFLEDMTELEWLSIWPKTNATQYAPKCIPSLKNSPGLRSAGIGAGIEDLGFIADNTALEFFGCEAYATEIKDISGLRNKPELRSLSLYNVNCSDMSVLLELPALKKLEIRGTLIPDDIKEKLVSKGVEIKNQTMEEYRQEQRQKEEEEQREIENLRKSRKEIKKSPAYKKYKRDLTLRYVLYILIMLLIVLVTIRYIGESKKSHDGDSGKETDKH